MGSDRARNSYDPSRHYRAVVSQQGRVTLEADLNEAEEIANETLREQTLEIVGPSGTPDDGYRIDPRIGTFDFSVHAGSMYVGGVRVTTRGTTYTTQREWLDRQGDPLWIEPGQPASNTQPNEYVYLLLNEQEVSAVEDRTLREVALGGPDTTARKRIIQRIVRAPLRAQNCADARVEITKLWARQKARFNPKTLRLESPVRLQVNFVTPPDTTDPCDPPAQGGYLGADNQLIRVQITEYNSRSRRGRLVWGYNNASILYRVTVEDNRTLKLTSSPIDAYHTPKQNQAVEVLRSTVGLGNGDFIAAHTGQVLTLNQGYEPETRLLPLPSALPAVFTDRDASPQVFLRLWEQELEFTDGIPVALGTNGLEVTVIGNGAASRWSLGQYWMFAVRPNTPTQLYPQRYLDAPQPPEGPRQWACPLAVIGGGERGRTLLDDCREPFENLVTLTKRRRESCCGITIEPKDLERRSLQAILDVYAGRQITVTFRPGRYRLRETLRLGPKHAGFTLEGCSHGAILEADANQTQFTDGLIALTHANGVKIRNLTFEIKTQPPLVIVFPGSDARVNVGIALRPITCQDLTVEDCVFVFRAQSKLSELGIGIFAGGTNTGWCIQRNRFIGNRKVVTPDAVRDLLQDQDTFIGLAVMPSFQPIVTPVAVAGTQNFQLLRSSVHRWTITENHMEGITVATLIVADTGKLRCQNNEVLECHDGFVFLSLRSLALAASETANVAEPSNVNDSFVAGALFVWILVNPSNLGSFAGLLYPLPTGWDTTNEGLVLGEFNRDTGLEGAFEASQLLGNLASAFDASAFNHERALSLDFSHNHVDLGIGSENTGSTIFLWDTEVSTNSVLTFGQNRLRNFANELLPTNSQQPNSNPQISPFRATAFFWNINILSITGNVITNEAPAPTEGQDPYCLFFFPMAKDVVAHYAIAGNVLIGKTNLDTIPRPDFPTVPFNNWRFVNTEV
jgi:Family of unknown function (DUF6519)